MSKRIVKQKKAGPFEVDKAVFVVEPFNDPIFVIFLSNVGTPEQKQRKWSL